jgi:hypothetical protein
MNTQVVIKGKTYNVGDKVWYGLNYGEPDQKTFVEGYVCFGRFDAEIFDCYGYYVGTKEGYQLSEAGLTEKYIIIESVQA